MEIVGATNVQTAYDNEKDKKDPSGAFKSQNKVYWSQRKVSAKFYGDAYSALPDMSFAHSEALLLSDSEPRQDIQTAYVQQCQVLCLGSFPTWQQVEDCLAELLP